MDDKYTQKYLKYKRKYLALEREMQLVGGTGFLSKIASDAVSQAKPALANAVLQAKPALANAVSQATPALANVANQLKQQALSTATNIMTSPSVQAGLKAGILETIKNIKGVPGIYLASSAIKFKTGSSEDKSLEDIVAVLTDDEKKSIVTLFTLF